MINSHNIYIHVPFCISKCNYCCFFSHSCATPDWNAYSENIINEIHHWSEFMGKIPVPTVFFGGGTPSLMPPKVLEKIINCLRTEFLLTPDCEITLEANPGTIDENKLDDFIATGINRLSIGIQSFDDDKLKFLGRRHDAKTARNIINIAMQRKIRLSADFIYGLPGEKLHDIINLCHDINSLGLLHCSMYELSIEPGTPFATMNFEMPSNEEMADMYSAISDNLKLQRYEVSNYAVPGNECKHNLNVWDGQPYIGIGKGAAGRILIEKQWYEQLGNGEKFEKIPDTMRAEERIITGLRQIRGVYLDNDIKKIINMQYVRDNPELLQKTSDNRIAATKKGMLILDDLILHLVR